MAIFAQRSFLTTIKDGRILQFSRASTYMARLEQGLWHMGKPSILVCTLVYSQGPIIGKQWRIFCPLH